MRICYYTDSISEHQIPLVLELIKHYGEENFRYFYKNDRAAHRKAMMGADAEVRAWTLKISDNREVFEDWVENADVLYTIFRVPDLLERRINRRLRTFYMSERWLKPPTGWLRLLHPGYFRLAKRMIRCFESGLVTYLPTGIVAATDMLRIKELVTGHPIRAFLMMRPEFERHVSARVVGCDWIRLWGYFVKPGAAPSKRRTCHTPLRVLWVGRYLALKRVDTIIRAVLYSNGVELDLYGSGDKEEEMKRLARGCERIRFHPSVPLEHVRTLMRTHDVYVMSSNGFDGWGAVVSEALEEGMMVLGTDVVGAPATTLPSSNQFRVGDWRALATLLKKIADGEGDSTAPQFVKASGWRVSDAFNALIEMIQEPLTE